MNIAATAPSPEAIGRFPDAEDGPVWPNTEKVCERTHKLRCVPCRLERVPVPRQGITVARTDDRTWLISYWECHAALLAGRWAKWADAFRG